MSELPKDVLFSPQNITEHHRCYDYVESLRKDETPVLSVETAREIEMGIHTDLAFSDILFTDGSSPD